MISKARVLRNTYRDSVLLMKIASFVRTMNGVENAEVMLGTKANKETLSRTPLFSDDVKGAGPNDLIICVIVEDEEKGEEALRKAEELLLGGMPNEKIAHIAKSLDSAIAMLPEANLALLSIPGLYVKKYAVKALARGLNLLIFSDNVPVQHEVEIKRLAGQRNALVMGPDCGTAIIKGVALGFANRVRRGSIGLIGASGTGLQEVSVLVHALGLGISHAIGAGSRDASDEVGGLTMIKGIMLLQADRSTKVIVVISKHPGPQTMEKLLETAKKCTKPVILNFLGVRRNTSSDENVAFTCTLEETALKAAKLANHGSHNGGFSFVDSKEVWSKVKSLKMRLRGTQKYVRGLFAGGTLATEACVLMRDQVSPLFGNIVLGGVTKLVNSGASQAHCIIDLGADEFTKGKPHPMLEPEMRKERLLTEAKDPSVAAILLDFVLGYGVHPDPADATIPYIDHARQIAKDRGDHLVFVASVCGTDEDPQVKNKQVNVLKEHDVIVCATNAEATRVATSITLRS